MSIIFKPTKIPIKPRSKYDIEIVTVTGSKVVTSLILR